MTSRMRLNLVITASPSGPVRGGPATVLQNRACAPGSTQRENVGGDAISLASDTGWRCEISSSEDTGGCKYTDHGGEQN